MTSYKLKKSIPLYIYACLISKDESEKTEAFQILKFDEGELADLPTDFQVEIAFVENCLYVAGVGRDKA